MDEEARDIGTESSRSLILVDTWFKEWRVADILVDRYHEDIASQNI